MADLVLIGAGVVGLGAAMQVLGPVARQDPDLLRLHSCAVGVLDLLDLALAIPGVVERITDLAGDRQAEPVPAPGRDQLVAIANS
jgi:hypothetical protein